MMLVEDPIIISKLAVRKPTQRQFVIDVKNWGILLQAHKVILSVQAIRQPMFLGRLERRHVWSAVFPQGDSTPYLGIHAIPEDRQHSSLWTGIHFRQMNDPKNNICAPTRLLYVCKAF
jgi:hypothetical protein